MGLDGFEYWTPRLKIGEVLLNWRPSVTLIFHYIIRIIIIYTLTHFLGLSSYRVGYKISKPLADLQKIQFMRQYKIFDKWDVNRKRRLLVLSLHEYHLHAHVHVQVMIRILYIHHLYGKLKINILRLVNLNNIVHY